MTYEEALYWHTHNGATIEQEIECEILIKEAIEKQIPKKPNLWNGKITTCPNCLRAIRQTEALDVHCMYCGQALDWSDME